MIKIILKLFPHLYCNWNNAFMFYFQSQSYFNSDNTDNYIYFQEYLLVKVPNDNKEVLNIF